MNKVRFNFANSTQFVVAPVEKYGDYRWLVLLLGESGGGKSTLMAQLPGPMAMVDIDGRAPEVASLIPEGQFYALSQFAELMAEQPGYASMGVVERSQLMVDIGSEWLTQMVPAIGAKAICWDTITPIVEPMINELMRRGDMTPDDRVKAGYPKNKESVWQPKASVMKVIRASQSLGTHCIWTAHYEQSGKDKTAKATIPEAELHDFSKNLNVRLKTVKEGKRYGVKIEWARHRPAKQFPILWDAEGNYFKGMWERIWETIYGNGTGNGKAAPAPADEPVSFVDFVKPGVNFPPESVDGGAPDRKVSAVRMATEYTVTAKDGQALQAFSHRKHAEAAYDQVRNGKLGKPAPTSSDEMATMWVEYTLEKAKSALADYESSLAEARQEAFPEEFEEVPEQYYSNG